VAGLLKLSRAIDALNFRIGKTLSWLILIVVIISATNATIRKFLDTSSNAWLELQWVLFGVIFLLCSPWTLLSNEHIRIDIVNGMLPKRWRDVIDVVGHVFFLLPLTIVMIVTSIPFFLRSLQLNEQSMNAGGLPQWPAKSLILIGFFLLFLQCISELIKRVAVMQGRIRDPHDGGGLSATVEAEAERILAAARTDTN
jgi:TRAP-type mannitol/chloroaromatic compound transport system permease small subunit